MGYGQGGWRIFKGRIKGVNFFSLQSSNHLDFHFWKKSLLSSKSKQCWINLTVHSDNLTKRDLSFLRGFPFFMRALCFRSFFVSRYIFEHISYPIPHIFENLNQIPKKWKTPDMKSYPNSFFVGYLGTLWMIQNPLWMSNPTCPLVCPNVKL